MNRRDIKTQLAALNVEIPQDEVTDKLAKLLEAAQAAKPKTAKPRKANDRTAVEPEQGLSAYEL